MLKTTEEAKRKRMKAPSLGIALGGGGPFGGIYEIGALRALDESLSGLNLNDLSVYIGVNSGAFVAANLANQMTPAQMCRIFVRNEADVHPFHPDVFYRPAYEEYLRSALMIPRLLGSALFNLAKNPNDQSLLESLTVLAKAVPTGIFDNEGFHQYLTKSYSSVGRTNDFRRLKKKLLIVAADLQTGETVHFGDQGHRTIPISKAIQASMASPGIYKPVEVQGRHYVDGTLNKGLHASVALDQGADVVLAINPVVPIDVFSAVAAETMANDDLVNSGMPAVISQAYRTMVYSRLRSGMKVVAHDYPDAPVLLFEPKRNDARLFFSSVFSFKARKMICEEAYQMTRESIRNRADEMEDALRPFGIKLRHDVLADDKRTLRTGLYGETLPVFNANAGVREQTNATLADEPESYFEKMTQRVAALF